MSLVTIGEAKAVLLLWAKTKLHVHAYGETVWHFAGTERLSMGAVFAVLCIHNDIRILNFATSDLGSHFL